jgi:hypothetical protein
MYIELAAQWNNCLLPKFNFGKTFLGGCPDGWQSFQGKRCFYFSALNDEYAENWSEASNMCRKLTAGSFLASIRD